MKVDTIQTSFVGGEIAPSLYGRTDVSQYENACAIVENFLVRPYGPLISTPGTEFINECKTGGTTSIARLIQFVFSRTDSYIIEMGVGYFRFYTDGSYVVSPGTTVYEVAHTYTATEIPQVQYCQLNDIIYLVHSNHRPKKLVRYSATSWALEDFAFIGGPFLDDNTTAITLTPSATAGTITVTVSPTNSNLFIPSGATIGHLNSYWRINGPITSATTGLSVQGYVKLTAITNSYTATATVMQNLKATAATTDWAEGAWSEVNGYPASVTFFQQRLFFARTDQEPQAVWGSKSFVYDDFAVELGNADDAINITLASNESNDIKWLVPTRGLVAGTYGGEYVISSGDNSPLTPSNTNANKETSWGSEPIIPKKIGSYFYYIQRFGQKLRELFYTWDTDSYKSVDKTILSPHIAGEGGFQDLSYQQNPDTVLWCVCSNGTLATMTREIDQEVQGWARQTTDGIYESIATIPSKDENHDEVWVVVKRTINGAVKRYVERFKSQEVPDRQDKCWYVHSGLSYDAFDATTSPTATSISLSGTAGTIVVTSSANYFASGDVGQRIRVIDADGATTGELKITGYTSATIVVGTVKTNFASTTASTGYWGLSVQEISGLDHLEGKTVTVLADGGTDKPNKVVSSGTITLAYDYFVVTIGLPYSQKITTLSQEKGSQRGTSQGKIQRINQVGFKVNRSYKGFNVGGTAATVERVSFRDPSTLLGTPELLYTGVMPNISFNGDYAYGAQVVIQNDDPLPIELLNVITSIDTNDK
jgi:hypothetical protein